MNRIVLTIAVYVKIIFMMIHFEFEFNQVIKLQNLNLLLKPGFLSIRIILVKVTRKNSQ